jgi:hypothetical protein
VRQQPGHILARNAYVTAAWPDYATHEIDGSGLSRTIRTDDSEDLVFIDVKGQVGYSGEAAEVTRQLLDIE